MPRGPDDELVAEGFATERGTMRRLIVSLVAAGAIMALGAGPAAAAPPAFVELPGAACNQGTARAHERAPHHSKGHPHIPHEMAGMCMTMPAGGGH